MKFPIDHKEGQYKTELFEEVIYFLLVNIYGKDTIKRHFLLPKKSDKVSSSSIDFIVEKANNTVTMVEAKAAYTETPSKGLNRSFRRIKSLCDRYPFHESINEIIIAINTELPNKSLEEYVKTKEYFEKKEIKFQLWDFLFIKHLLAKKTGLKFGTFSIHNLEKAVLSLHGKEVIKESKGKTEVEISKSRKDFGLEKYAGQLKEVIVLVGDFCSYSKFLHASGEDRDLVTSIMGRFYRESRQIIHSYGGILDKFIGDGFLAYWFIDKDDDYIKSQLDRCTRELIGFAVDLANEWQEHIDYSVEPKGLKAGATVGYVFFIPEDAHGIGCIHAIGDSINLAERLQSVAYPNVLVISNKLRKRFFENDEFYEELPPTTLKNIGDILAWKKHYE